MESKRFSPPYAIQSEFGTRDVCSFIPRGHLPVILLMRCTFNGVRHAISVSVPPSVNAYIQTLFCCGDFLFDAHFHSVNRKVFCTHLFLIVWPKKPPTRNIRLFTTSTRHQAITTPHTMDWNRRKRRMEKWNATLGVFCWPHNITSLSHAHANCCVFYVSSSNQHSKIEHIGKAMASRSCAPRG